MITTKVIGKSAWATGNFYHEVSIYRDDELIEKISVHCCEDDEEASYYAVSLSKALSQEEKENFMF